MTIKKRLIVGFGTMIVVIILLTIANMASARAIYANVLKYKQLAILRTELSERIIEHLMWTEKLSSILLDPYATEVDVETDPHKTVFGKWYYSDKKLEAEKLVPGISDLLKQIEQPLIAMHQSVLEMQPIIVSNHDGATGIYDIETLPNLKQTQQILNKIKDKIAVLAEKTQAKVILEVKFLVLLVLVLGLLAMILGTVFATVIYQSICKVLFAATDKISAGTSQVATAAQRFHVRVNCLLKVHLSSRRVLRKSLPLLM